MWNWEELSDKEVETDDTLGSDDDDDAEEGDDPNDTRPSMSSGPGNNQIDGPVVTHSVILTYITVMYNKIHTCNFHSS